MYKKQCRKEFSTKCIFSGPKSKKKKKELSCKKRDFFVCFLAVKYVCQIPHQKFFVLSFFILCIALRYAENNPQKHFQTSAYFRGQHLAKIKNYAKKAILALKCVYRNSSTEVIIIFIIFSL